MIDGYSYIATGQEVHEQDEEATWRGEFLSLQLGDGLSIQYGGGLGAYISHEEYLLTKELLLRIIASLRSPEEVQQTAVSTSVSTETPQPTVTAGTILAPTATPLSYVVEPEGQYENWHKYTNLTYGFSFSFPADWNVYTRDHSVWVRQGKQGLNIGVRWPREEVRIQRTGVGAGELIAEGTVDFLGQTLSRTVLVYEGKDKTVLYSSAVELEVDGRIFTLSVDYFDDPAIVLSEEVQQTADKILETFELVEPESLSNS
jgi:hypothetical protein